MTISSGAGIDRLVETEVLTDAARRQIHDARQHRLAPPGLIALGNLLTFAPFVLLAVVLHLELVGFGALLAGFGIWYFGLAHRLRRWERRTGRRLLLRPICRWRGTNDKPDSATSG